MPETPEIEVSIRCAESRLGHYRLSPIRGFDGRNRDRGLPPNGGVWNVRVYPDGAFAHARLLLPTAVLL